MVAARSRLVYHIFTLFVNECSLSSRHKSFCMAQERLYFLPFIDLHALPFLSVHVPRVNSRRCNAKTLDVERAMFATSLLRHTLTVSGVFQPPQTSSQSLPNAVFSLLLKPTAPPMILYPQDPVENTSCSDTSIPCLIQSSLRNVAIRVRKTISEDYKIKQTLSHSPAPVGSGECRGLNRLRFTQMVP